MHRLRWFLAVGAALALLSPGCSSTGSGGLTCQGTQQVCGNACIDVAADARNCGACGMACGAGQVCVTGRCQADCPEGQQICGDVCANPQTDRAHCGGCGMRCPSGQVCAAGQCSLECGPSLARCVDGSLPDGGLSPGGGDDVCADAQTDRLHCGGCGIVCAMGQICRAGRCTPTCPSGQSACGDRCVSLQADDNNCGACGTPCGSGFVCIEGRCRISGCAQGNTVCGGRCVNLMADRSNCGTCGTFCPFGEVCTAGRCGGGCAAGQIVCGTTCVDPQASSRHCGRCDNACPAGQVCQMGACATVCQMGQTLCAGRCVDLTNDRAHCGACGTACPGSQVCTGGMCAAACAMGQTACGTVCTPLASDPANCGMCGRACAAGQACVSGVCTGVVSTDGGCLPPSFVCAGACVDTRNDNLHCGMCGRRCTADRICVDAQCAEPCTAGQSRCGAACINTATDPLNCGGCGTACTGGLSCVMGMCTNAPPTRYERVTAPSDVTFVDACAAPGVQRLHSGVDDAGALVPLPFAFRYWATDLAAGAMVNVSSNGFMSLLPAVSSSLGGTIPSVGAPNAVIAAYWRDLVVGAPGMCLATVGAAPSRRWVVQWANTRPFGGGTTMDFEIVLHEGSNLIDLMYRTMDSANGTVGVENQAGNAAVSGCPTATSYSCAPMSNSRVRFRPIP